MFTGLIEEIGTIRNMIRTPRENTLVIEGEVVISDTQVGDSVAVNGVCLTVTKLEGNLFWADVMDETFRRSSLGQLKNGDPVNLERALQLNSRLGGHLVSGHIDCTGAIRSRKRENNALWFTVQTNPGQMKYIVEKGSVAIDGTSLTVAGIGTDYFQVSVIPHTRKATIMEAKKEGDVVNLEYDVIGKYVERMLNPGKERDTDKKNMDQNILSQNGFF